MMVQPVSMEPFVASVEQIRGDFFLVFVQPQGTLRGRYRLWQSGEGLQSLVEWTLSAGRAPSRSASMSAHASTGAGCGRAPSNREVR